MNDCFPTGRYYAGIQIDVEVPGLCSLWSASHPWQDIPVCVVDLETTGFDPAVDKIVEVAVVRFEGGQMVRKDNWLVNPGIPIPPDATKVHGITDEDVAGEPSWGEVAPLVMEALEGALPCAYNAAFDKSFLSPASPISWLDPLVWSRDLDSEHRMHRLEVVCKRYGIAIARAHRAWADAEATGRLLYALAPRMPETYGEVIRIQAELAKRQEADRDRLNRIRGKK